MDSSSDEDEEKNKGISRIVTGIVKAAVSEERKSQNIKERLKEAGTRSVPLNEWDVSNIFSTTYKYEVVNEIPHVCGFVPTMFSKYSAWWSDTLYNRSLFL